MNLISLVIIPFLLAYSPKIKVYVHKDCIYSKALLTLLDWSDTEYERVDVDKNLELLQKEKKMPQVFLDGKRIGGYQNSLKQWTTIYKMLPFEKDSGKLYDPEYVVAKYGGIKNRVNIRRINVGSDSKKSTLY